MKALNYFVVELDKLMNDELQTESGMKLYIDTRFDEFEHRVVEGPVVSTPHKYDTPVKIGDTLYFHHHVVINGGSAISDNPNHYWVRFDPDVCINNQAIAYKDSDTGEIHCLGQWCLMNPIDQEDEFTSDLLDIIDLGKRRPPQKAELWKGNESTSELDLNSGDVVGFRKNMDYSIVIDGKERYRVDAADLLYIYND